MSEFVTIQEHIERRTYIKGKFTGKFIGYLDHKKSDLLHENFYDLEVLSGEIKTIKDEHKKDKKEDTPEPTPKKEEPTPKKEEPKPKQKEPEDTYVRPKRTKRHGDLP